MLFALKDRIPLKLKQEESRPKSKGRERTQVDVFRGGESRFRSHGRLLTPFVGGGALMRLRDHVLLAADYQMAFFFRDAKDKHVVLLKVRPCALLTRYHRTDPLFPGLAGQAHPLHHPLPDFLSCPVAHTLRRPAAPAARQASAARKRQQQCRRPRPAQLGRGRRAKQRRCFTRVQAPCKRGGGRCAGRRRRRARRGQARAGRRGRLAA